MFGGNDDDGIMMGVAFGLANRIRNQNHDHAIETQQYQLTIGEAVAQRDNYAVGCIARDHQIDAMREAMNAILNQLPVDHPMRQSTAAVDMQGKRLTRVQIAIGSDALRRAIADKFVYFDTLRLIAPLVGVRRDQSRAWELRNQLAKDGEVETARQLLQALR